MCEDETEEARKTWDSIASGWDVQVGDEGDSNRILNSDPVLWEFAGDISGLSVLDAGCGTGYLTRKLHERGAKAVGVDFSERMIEIAREKSPDIDYREDSCSDLGTVDDASLDMVIANYVLMDTPDLEGTMRAFNRVLRDEGVAIIIFSHPCFPQGTATVLSNEEGVNYHWSFNYFNRQKRIDPPWAHFKSEFIWFHRSLSDYWKAFKTAGFSILDFEEPRLTEKRYHLAQNKRELTNGKSRPYSVAFKLQKNCISKP